MTKVMNLRAVAARFGMSYEWVRDNWRTLPGFPRPFIGGKPHQHPRWTEEAIEAFMKGQTAPSAEADTPAPVTRTPPPPEDDIDEFLKLAG